MSHPVAGADIAVPFQRAGNIDIYYEVAANAGFGAESGGSETEIFPDEIFAGVAQVAEQIRAAERS